MTGRNWCRLLFAVYITFTIKIIVFKYPLDELLSIAAGWSLDSVVQGSKSANLRPMHTIAMYLRYRDRLNSFENLIGNIVAFVPFGILFPIQKERTIGLCKTLAYAFGFALSLEVFQLISAFGAFDVDDILLNCFGAVLGYLIYSIIWRKK